MVRIIPRARSCTGSALIEWFLNPYMLLKLLNSRVKSSETPARCGLVANRLLWGTLLVLAVLFPGSEIGAEGDESKVQTTDIDTSRWLCSLCLYPMGWFGALDFGPGNVSDSSLKFGDYRGLEESGLFLHIAGETHYRNEDGRYFDLYARNLAIDSRRIEMRGGEQGRYEVRLGYNEIPKYRGFGTETVFSGVGSGQLTLPGDWVKSAQTRGMTTLDQSLAGTPLKTTRKTLDAGLTLKFASKWSYRLDFEHQEKDGTRSFGAGLFLSSATHIPAPVDFTTNRFDMSLEYAGERSNLSIGFMGSSFKNDQSTLTWENPFLSDPGTEVFRAALAPDNEYYQFSLTGAFAPAPKLRFSGRVAIGRMQQDDPFLPFSTNPSFSDLALPRSSLDGKIDASTLNLAGKLTARLARRLDLTARIKLDERDNKTAVDLWTPVLADLVLTAPRPNRPYSFERQKYEIELRWRARNGLRLMGGIRHENIERSLQNVKETEQRIYWGEVTFSPWSVAQFRLKVESSERDASPFILLDDGGPVENPLMRKFHLAERDRDRVIIELDLSPLDRLGISLSYFSAEDDYSASVIGLRESDERSLSLDLNYAINSNLSFYAFAAQDDIDAEISSISEVTNRAWNASTNDRITTLGIGFSGKINDKVSLGFDWVSSDATGKIRTDSGQGEAPFPALKSDLRNARVHVSYAVNDRWAMKIYAEHEKFDSADWLVDGLGPDGMSSVLTLGAVSPDYTVTVWRVLSTYKF